jgi:acyl dehydratase
MGKRYWEDLVEGRPLPCQTLSLSQEEIIEFARKYDPQPFHVNEAAAATSIFGGIIASSLHTLSATTRVIVDALGDLAIVSGLGMDEILMPNPVRPGDVLTVDARWSGLRRSKSKPELGIAGVRIRLVNQRGEPVMEFGFRYLVACRNPTVL